MTDPLEISLDVTSQLPPLTFSLDVTDAPSIRRLEQVRNFNLVAGQDIELDVFIKKLDSTLVPPALVPVDITGWASTWTLRDPADALIFFVPGGIVGAPINGQFKYLVTGAAFGTQGELMPSQLKFVLPASPSGAPDFVVDLQVTARALLSDT